MGGKGGSALPPVKWRLESLPPNCCIINYINIKYFYINSNVQTWS